MPGTTTADTTRLLTRAHGGDREAFDLLYARLYDDLRAVARRQRWRHRPRGTLDTTALVHEAYFRLVGETGISWECRSHFLAIAARAMRRVIVDYARERNARKRGGGRPHVTLPPEGVGVEQEIEGLLAIDEALAGLAEIDERLERVAECRLFGGLEHRETARALGVSVRTVERDWPRAKAWLQQALLG